MDTVDINIHNITRVEGHGNIVLNARNGKIEELRLEITESPRFFEAMLVGRKWDEAQHISCRICGICSIAHTNACLRAMEATLGVRPSEQTIVLRRLAHAGEMLQSHILHCYFLAAPDFLGAPSVVPLVETHQEVVLRALRMKRLANDICAVVAGRHVHPISMVVNGFTKLPKMDELLRVRDRLVECRKDAEATVELFASLKVPDFVRDNSEFLALHQPGEYPFITGSIGTTVGQPLDLESYLDVVKEYVVRHSHAKHAGLFAEETAYAVGALARFNLNHEWLHPTARAAADALGLKPVCKNPFLNNAAQVVEIVHCVEEALDLINGLEKRGLQPEDRSFEVLGGHGIGAVEAPRGTLFYEYQVDNRGVITAANLIIPTNQNLHSIEADMHALVPQVLPRPKGEIALTLEMLVRAYDPCISCGTHLLKVEFV